MLGVIAAIIASAKKRTGWAVIMWISAIFWIIAAIGGAEAAFASGWLWLIIALCLKKRQPEQQTIVVNNYVTQNGAGNYDEPIESVSYQVLDGEAVRVDEPQALPAQQEIYLPQPAAEEPSPVSRPKFCTNCGTPLKEGQKFCPECGSKVQG